MSIWRRSQDQLPAGVYDEVVSEALEGRLAELEQTHAIDVADVKKDSDVDEQLVTLVRDAARIAIEARSNALEKVAVARELLGHLGREGYFRAGETVLRDRVLRGIAERSPGRGSDSSRPPRGSLLSSGLITNAHGESVLSHLASEFASADRIDLLCSFIKLSGLDKFRPLIERHRALGRPLRVLTTTYMRATEVKAIELLHRLGAEVRVSYDDASTRLHAKAWLFHRQSEYGQVDSLLFVAHRKELLEQSRRAFRQVLRREHFGELWVDGQRPEVGRHVFASIQSLSQAMDLAAAAFDHVIVDEVHHAAADSYVALLDRLAPKQLVGLTATPERADARLYEEHFPRPYVGNLRVWDAIEQQVLVPFRYFVLDVEGLDLSEARWNGGYVDSDLSQRLIRAQDLWVHAVTRAIAERIARPEES